jgi:hypothetical protein
VVSNRAARHRRGRPTPAAPVVDEFDAFDEDELLYVFVNYHRSPLGAWTAILVPDGLEPVALQATSAHDALHKAMELVEVLSEHADWRSRHLALWSAPKPRVVEPYVQCLNGSRPSRIRAGGRTTTGCELYLLSKIDYNGSSPYMFFVSGDGQDGGPGSGKS